MTKIGTQLWISLIVSACRDTMKYSSTIEITVSKQSFVLQLWGYRLPRATMHYLARLGFLFLSYLTVEIAIVGRVCPTSCLILEYLAWVMGVQLGRLLRPKYSSSYPLFQVSWSEGVRRCMLRRVGISRLLRLAAETFWKMEEVKESCHLVLYILWKGQQLRVSWEVDIRWGES